MFVACVGGEESLLTMLLTHTLELQLQSGTLPAARGTQTVALQVLLQFFELKLLEERGWFLHFTLQVLPSLRVCSK